MSPLPLPEEGQLHWAAPLNESLEQLNEQTVVTGRVVGDNLVLTSADGLDHVAGNVRGPQGSQGNPGPPGTGNINSVNGSTGPNVVLTAADVGALPVGAPIGAPVGSVVMFAGVAAPTDWVICNGAALSRVDYPALFEAISTRWGAGDGSTTFNIPPGGIMPVAWKSADADFGTVGATGGEKRVSLSVANMPAHNHGGATGSTVVPSEFSLNISTTNTAGNSRIARGGSTTVLDNPITKSYHTHTIASEGSGTSHNNLPPFGVFTFIIKVR